MTRVIEIPVAFDAELPRGDSRFVLPGDAWKGETAPDSRIICRCPEDLPIVLGGAMRSGVATIELTRDLDRQRARATVRITERDKPKTPTPQLDPHATRILIAVAALCVALFAIACVAVHVIKTADRFQADARRPIVAGGSR